MIESYVVAMSIMAGIYALLALGLSLHYGFTGLINFGHVGFYAIGAYTSAILTLNDLPIPLGIAAAMTAAGIAAAVVGMFAIRLRHEYLAIVTLAFSEIVRIVAISERDLTGGNIGLTGIPRPFAWAGRGQATEFLFLGLVVLAVALTVLVMLRLVRSPFGRLIQAIRDDEEAVRAIGKDPARYKLLVFVIGAVIAGLAGALYAHYITYISPDQFTPVVTFHIWIAMILGGTSRISGGILGSVLLLGFLEGSRFFRDVVPWIPEVQIASIRLSVVGLLLIVFIIFMPNGILGLARRR